jgi:hypothetical protein
MAVTITLFAAFPVRIVVISLYWDTSEEFLTVSSMKQCHITLLVIYHEYEADFRAYGDKLPLLDEYGKGKRDNNLSNQND